MLDCTSTAVNISLTRSFLSVLLAILYFWPIDIETTLLNGGITVLQIGKGRNTRALGETSKTI